MALLGPPNIGRLKAKGNVEGLIKALGYEKDRDVREAAAETLGKIGAPAVEPLIRALGDTSPLVRWYVAQALGNIGDRRAVEPLIAALGDKDIYVREYAAGALGKIGDARAVEPLIKALGDGDKDVRRDAAAVALEKLGWKPDSGEDGARYWINKENWEECVSIGAPAVEPLLKVLNQEVSAAWALGEIGDARAVKPLSEVRWNGAWIMCETADLALVKIGTPEALEAIKKTPRGDYL